VYGSLRSAACSASRPTRKPTRPKSRSVRPDSQDRTSGFHFILIEGDPLPVHLTRSRSRKFAKWPRQ
jgi:hypothetical protein